MRLGTRVSLWGVSRTALAVGAALALALGSAAPAAPSETVAAGPVRLWVAKYGGPTDYARATAVAASPGGARVFVTGDSRGPTSGEDFATVSYDAASGKQLWLARYNGPANGDDWTRAMAVAPDGRRVYVTGQSDGGQATRGDYATLAYDAATGTRIWMKRFNGPSNYLDHPSSLAIGPDGSTIFVTGVSWRVGSSNPSDALTIAYEAATGRRLWLARYDGVGNSWDEGKGIAASPDGRRVYVAADSYGGPATGGDCATVAYDARTGARLWATRYDNPQGWADGALDVVVAPASDRVFASGFTFANPKWTILAYDAKTGGELWTVRRDGAWPYAIGVDPDGTNVFVTGDGGETYATVAYDAASGSERWSTSARPGYSVSLAVSGRGDRLFVTGPSLGDFLTLALDPGNGTEVWAARYDSPGVFEQDGAADVAVAPGAGTIFVTGTTIKEAPGTEREVWSYGTVAYRAA